MSVRSPLTHVPCPQRHAAACAGAVAMIEALQSQGVDVNIRSKDGFTPICFAAEEGHLSCLDRLVELVGRYQKQKGFILIKRLCGGGRGWEKGW